MRKLTGFLCVVGALSCLSAGAEPLSLQQAVEEALQDSPVVHQADSKYEQAVWEKRGALQGFLPHLSASADYITSQHYLYTDIDFGGAPASVPQIIPTSRLALRAQLPLFDGFSSTHTYWAGKSNQAAEGSFRDWTRFRLQRKVENEYFQVVAARLLRSVSEQNVKTLKDHLRDTRLQRKSGVSTQYDVLRVEVQVSNAEAELLNATDNIEIARMTLRESLGRMEADFEVNGELPELKADLVKDVSFEGATSERADIKGLGLKAESLERISQARHRFWVPRFSLFGEYQYYNNRNERFDDWDNYRDAYQFGFSMTWNLFDGMASLAKARESAEVSYQTQKSLDQSVLKAKTDFELWRRKYLYHCTVYRARQSDIQKATESVRLAREGRRVGVRTNTDFLDAESELYQAEAGAVRAKLGAIESLINLELALGKELIRLEDGK